MLIKQINLLCRTSSLQTTLTTSKNGFLSATINTPQCRNYHDPKTGHFEEEPPKTAYEQRLDIDKAKLKWRVPMHENTNEWKSKFGLFAPKKNEDVMFFHRTLDFTISGWKKRREAKRIEVEKFMQQFIPERHLILGNDLAAAHFVVHRGGSVKFVNQTNWAKKNEFHEYELPSKFNANFLIEAIKCDDMELYYEGLENIRRLKFMKFLSFRNVKPFDDWCLDRVSGSQFDNLEILDLSGTNITEKGLTALYRIPTLKMLIVDDPKKSETFEFTCLLLEDIIPNIKICGQNKVHDL